MMYKLLFLLIAINAQEFKTVETNISDRNTSVLLIIKYYDGYLSDILLLNVSHNNKITPINVEDIPIEYRYTILDIIIYAVYTSLILSVIIIWANSFKCNNKTHV